MKKKIDVKKKKKTNRKKKGGGGGNIGSCPHVPVDLNANLNFYQQFLRQN
jgi:hypothetical protein